VTKYTVEDESILTMEAPCPPKIQAQIYLITKSHKEILFALMSKSLVWILKLQRIACPFKL